jgi:hypothetical protein
MIPAGRNEQQQINTQTHMIPAGSNEQEQINTQTHMIPAGRNEQQINTQKRYQTVIINIEGGKQNVTISMNVTGAHFKVPFPWTN